MYKVYSILFLILILSCARPESDVSQSITNNHSENEVSRTYDSINKSSKLIDDKISNGTVKIYLENTLSMYGYIPSKNDVNTKFRDAVNEIIIASKANYNKEHVDLFLINNETLSSVDINNNLDEIDVKSLERNYKKGRGNSDFDKLFKKILLDWEQDEIVVFIADFIYSPGESNVESGLNGLRMNITEAFQDARNSELLTVNILHLESDFHGTYYDVKNKELDGLKNRPYYIFIFGNEKNVKTYSEGIMPKLKKYNLKNNYDLTSSETQINDYSALPFTLNKGQFASNSLTSNTSQIKSVTVKTSLDQSSTVQLAVSIDLSDVPVSDAYLMDIDNYSLNNNKIKIIDIGKIDDKQIQLSDGTQVNINPSDIPNIKSNTQLFLFSFPSTYNGSIDLALDKKMPIWIDNVSIKEGEDDKDIQTNTLKQSQTFGFNYIVEGIFDAQKTINPQNKYFQVSLNVGQEKTSSGIGTIIGWILGLLFLIIITVIILKNKQRK